MENNDLDFAEKLVESEKNRKITKKNQQIQIFGLDSNKTFFGEKTAIQVTILYPTHLNIEAIGDTFDPKGLSLFWCIPSLNLWVAANLLEGTLKSSRSKHTPSLKLTTYCWMVQNSTH